MNWCKDNKHYQRHATQETKMQVFLRPSMPNQHEDHYPKSTSEEGMVKQVIKVYRHNLPAWNFKLDDEHKGFVHRARKNTYKLFFEDPANSVKPIWIGMLVNNGTAWITWEKEMKAKYIEFCGSKVFFE